MRMATVRTAYAGNGDSHVRRQPQSLGDNRCPLSPSASLAARKAQQDHQTAALRWGKMGAPRQHMDMGCGPTLGWQRARLTTHSDMGSSLFLGLGNRVGVQALVWHPYSNSSESASPLKRQDSLSHSGAQARELGREGARSTPTAGPGAQVLLAWDAMAPAAGAARDPGRSTSAPAQRAGPSPEGRGLIQMLDLRAEARPLIRKGTNRKRRTKALLERSYHQVSSSVSGDRTWKNVAGAGEFSWFQTAADAGQLTARSAQGPALPLHSLRGPWRNLAL